MKIGLIHVLLVFALGLASARAAAPPDYDPEVMAALTKFTEVMEAGDAKAIERLIYVETLAQERMRSTIVPLVAAEKALERAALAKFGEDGKKFRCGFDAITASIDRKNLATAKISYDDARRNAHVERSGELAPMTLHRNSANQWQVVLEVIDDVDIEDRFDPPRPFPPYGGGRSEGLHKVQLDRLKALTDVFDQTRQRIENGELASAAAAQMDLTAKLAAANADASKARAAVFQRRPR